MSGEDNRRAQGACRFRRHGRGRVRPPGRRGGRRADGPPAREPRLPDGQRHAQSETDEIEKIRNALGPRCVGDLRRDAAAHAARGRRSPPPSRRAPPTPISSSPSAAARSPTAPRPCSFASPTTSAPSTTSTGSGRSRASRRRMKAPLVRQISVPTTIAGGEFSAIAGVTNPRTKVKEMLRHDLVMPRAVILDPAVTVHTPEWLWLSTGIRAVDHCVEGLCSREAHPLCRRPGAEGPVDAGAGAAAREGRLRRSRRPDGLPDRHLALDGAAVVGRADGRQPRHRLCARRRLRRAARLHLLRDAARR